MQIGSSDPRASVGRRGTLPRAAVVFEVGAKHFLQPLPMTETTEVTFPKTSLVQA